MLTFRFRYNYLDHCGSNCGGQADYTDAKERSKSNKICLLAFFNLIN